MIPPKFGDIGKEAKGVFTSGYTYGSFKVDIKKKFRNGVEYICQTNTALDSMKMSGTLKSNFKAPQHGLNIDGNYSGGKLGANITLSDRFVKGSKIMVNTKFSPKTGQASGDIKTSYQQEFINATVDSTLVNSTPVLVASSVIGFEGFVAGYQITFNTLSNSITKNNVALGYQDKETEFYVTSNNAVQFGTSVFRQVKPDTSVGVQMAWDRSNGNKVSLGLGGVYKVKWDTSLGCKINDSGQIGFNCTSDLGPTTKLTLSALVNAATPTTGGHKIGLSLSFQL